MKFTKGLYKSTGKCHVCGKSTKLNIHEGCGKKKNPKRKRAKYDEKFLNYVSDVY